MCTTTYDDIMFCRIQTNGNTISQIEMTNDPNYASECLKAKTKSGTLGLTLKMLSVFANRIMELYENTKNSGVKVFWCYSMRLTLFNHLKHFSWSKDLKRGKSFSV